MELLEIYKNLFINYEKETNNFKNNTNEIFELISNDMFGFSIKSLFKYNINIVTKIDIKIDDNEHDKCSSSQLQSNCVSVRANLQGRFNDNEHDKCSSSVRADNINLRIEYFSDTKINCVSSYSFVYNDSIPHILEDYNNFTVRETCYGICNIKMKKFNLVPEYKIGKFNIGDCHFICWITVEMFDKFKEDWRKKFENMNK